ncbi:MAG: SDR family oxidoreductase [Mycobacterium sp.]
MKTAVVTGAAGAIGSAICGRLVTRGYQVLAVDMDVQGLQRLPDSAIPVRADLTDPDFHAAVLAAVNAAGGHCDLLINNAGIVLAGPIEGTDPDDIHREQLINLHAPMLLTRTLLPALQHRRGHVISVVSLAAIMPLPESLGYSASKAGLRAFMLGLALRQRETGVKISLVHPGAVDTPMLRREAANGGSALNFLTTPLSPGTVADAVVANLDRPRLERFLPRHDGWLIKILGLNPAAMQHIRPLLERAAKPGLERYRRQHEI